MNVISPSGPRVSFCHVEEQIPLLMHMPQPTPLEYLKKPFSVTLYGMTVDALKLSREVVIRYDSWSNDYVTTIITT
jgi:hypothetical protein